MAQKVLIGLLSLTVAVLAVMVAYLATSGPGEGDKGKDKDKDKDKDKGAKVDPETARAVVIAKEGEPVATRQGGNPPPEPKPVGNPDRLRQTLVPGKVYVTHVKGDLNARGSNADWGIEGIVTINYGFEALIDREIESNDGDTIVEVRHFRSVRSLRAICKIDDAHLDFGPLGKALLPPQWRTFTDGLNLKPLLNTLPWANDQVIKLLGQGTAGEVFGRVNKLTGKSVRLTYKDGKGVIKVEPVKGEMTAGEFDFHSSSVLVSDSLIFPNEDITDKESWSVEGSNFSAFLDPSFMARTSGSLRIKRDGTERKKFTIDALNDKLDCNELCVRLKVESGRLNMDDSTDKQMHVGHFDPKGDVFYSQKQRIIVAAELEGSGRLERASRDHVLFQARMARDAKLRIKYACAVRDAVKGK